MNFVSFVWFFLEMGLDLSGILPHFVNKCPEHLWCFAWTDDLCCSTCHIGHSLSNDMYPMICVSYTLCLSVNGPEFMFKGMNCTLNIVKATEQIDLFFVLEGDDIVVTGVTPYTYSLFSKPGVLLCLTMIFTWMCHYSLMCRHHAIQQAIFSVHTILPFFPSNQNVSCGKVFMQPGFHVGLTTGSLDHFLEKDVKTILLHVPVHAIYNVI